MFTDGRLDGQTDAREFPDRMKSFSGLRPEELMISKSASKGPSNLDSRYPSMPEPTSGLGGPLVPRPTGKLSSNTCPEILTFWSTHIISHAHKVIKKVMKYMRKIRM